MYSCLVRSRRCSVAETTPLNENDANWIEAAQTTHLRRSYRIPYTANAPNAPVRRSSEVGTVEPCALEARLRTWGLARRESPHSFFKATRSDRADDKRHNAKLGNPYVTLIEEAVEKVNSPAYLQFRDWCLDPERLLDAQDMYRGATVEAWP